MRLEHLTDYEIQEHCDRKLGGGDNLPGDRIVERHLKNCPLCAEQAREYEELGMKISACPIPPLSTDFTARVISRLPASRKLWRIPLGMPAAILSPIAALITLLLKVNLEPVAGLVISMMIRQYFSLRFWWDMLPVPNLSVPSISLDWSFLQQLQASMPEPSKAAILILLVSVTLLTFASIEKLVFGKAFRRF